MNSRALATLSAVIVLVTCWHFQAQADLRAMKAERDRTIVRNSVIENGAGRGGGDSIFCSGRFDMRNYFGGKIKLTGYYALDFIGAENPLSGPDLNTISLRVHTKLAKTLPALASSYQLFLSSFLNQSWTTIPDYANTLRIWKPVKHLKDIPDEELEAAYGQVNQMIQVPLECQENGHPVVYQTVLRQGVVQKNGFDIIEYFYDPTIMASFQRKPLQQSFILVHEWLRDFVPSAAAIRRLNSYLHSSNFIEDTEDEVATKISRMGLNDPRLLKRPAEIREEINGDLQVLRYIDYARTNHQVTAKEEAFLKKYLDTGKLNVDEVSEILIQFGESDLTKTLSNFRRH